MAFTDDELAYLRTKLGTSVTEDTVAGQAIVDDLETRFARLQDVRLVAVEVLRERLADVANVLENPLNFNVSGEYSQDASANVAFLTKMLAETEEEAGVPGSSVMTSISPADDRWRRGHVYPRHPDAGQYACYPYGR